MTKEQALNSFRESYGSEERYRAACKRDKTAVRTAWHGYTDMLCKDGDITHHQYNSWIDPKEFA
jgi:hypothetical protein